MSDFPESQEREVCLSESIRRFRATEVISWDDTPLGKYVHQLTDKTARTCMPGQHYGVRFVGGSLEDAIAAADGYIFIGRQVLPKLESEAELVALIAHELGHVAGGHGREPFILTELSDVAQLQADAFAVRCLKKLGYDARAVVSMLDGLLDKGSAVNQLRLESVRIVTRGWNRGRIDRNHYLAKISGMVVGMDPRTLRQTSDRWLISARSRFVLDGRVMKGAKLTGEFSLGGPGLGRLMMANAEDKRRTLAVGDWTFTLAFVGDKLLAATRLEEERELVIILYGKGDRQRELRLLTGLLKTARRPTKSEVDAIKPSTLRVVTLDHPQTLKAALSNCSDPALSRDYNRAEATDGMVSRVKCISRPPDEIDQDPKSP